ncbi:MAG: EscU/YscU/HrcU family type III secretion system export apparatus switch protein [Candidatus Eremiobacteraeota bacterium]|nr:EscU/YscU/HrcU family type III secretion system export apparatus switch protein [Candidatus Eremiobacteraeota bacterium]
MSDASEKQFDATPSRIAKARREGNLPRSQELPANVAFVAAALCAAAVSPLFSAAAQRAIAHAARGMSANEDSVAILACGVAVTAAGAGAAALAGFVQTGGLAIVAPSFKAARLSPAEGLKRMLSREAVTHAVRALSAFAFAGVAVIASMRAVFGVAEATSSVQSVAATAWGGAQHVVFAAAAVGLGFAIVEYGVARRSWLAKLKMSLHELKRELKENDGDPAARARRKALHRSVIRGAIAKVKDASFVVVNPTHVAVALEYRPPAVAVPVVLVRAAGDMALRVRALATETGVPVIENIPLARTLFAQTRAGDVIPHECYVAVAEIVAALIRSGALE